MEGDQECMVNNLKIMREKSLQVKHHSRFQTFLHLATGNIMSVDSHLYFVGSHW